MPCKDVVRVAVTFADPGGYRPRSGGLRICIRHIVYVIVFGAAAL